MDHWELTDLTDLTQSETRALILAGLEEHWGTLDPTLNADLDNMIETYVDGQTVVALQDARVVGTGTFVPRNQTTVEIVRMSVDADLRRSGLGRAIVEELCQRAHAAGFVTATLETSSSWTHVVAFYQSCDFVISHVEESPFGEDTWFVRTLSV